MSQQQPGAFRHQPVMVDEIVDLFRPVPAGTVIDATVGGGGHAAALLRAHPHLSVLGLDRDPAAVAAASATLQAFGDRGAVIHDRFDRIGAHIGDRTIVGVLFDLGVSSYQFDEGTRGFSYRADAPLDMRMDPSEDLTAAAVVNEYDEEQLARLFAENGETRFARRIARAIVRARPVSTTVQLAELVRNAIPAAARRHGGHPARRVFQALRIEVNGELRVLPAALDVALDVLVVGGRCAVLSYHSGEDRIVKDRFVVAANGGCVCPPGLPCACGAVPEFRLVRRVPRKPSAEEVAGNRRAESARLRAVERIVAAPVASAATGDDESDDR